MEPFFLETEGALSALEDAEPDCSQYEDTDADGEVYAGRRVRWIGTPGKMVKIPAANILTMEGNSWHFGYAACLRDRIRDGDAYLGAPAGRIYRVTAAEVKLTEKYERSGDLGYQVGMTRPWTRADVGDYHAQLLDGNHRAIAAIAAGEPYIWVYCGENYLANVRKKDLE